MGNYNLFSASGRHSFMNSLNSNWKDFWFWWKVMSHSFDDFLKMTPIVQMIYIIVAAFSLYVVYWILKNTILWIIFIGILVGIAYTIYKVKFEGKP